MTLKELREKRGFRSHKWIRWRIRAEKRRQKRAAKWVARTIAPRVLSWLTGKVQP